MITPFTSGPTELVNKLNEMVRIVNNLENMTGDGIVRVNQTTAGRSLSLNVDGLLQRLPKESGGGSREIIFTASCNENAPSGNTISCDIYGNDGLIESGVDVYCNISGGTGQGDLNEASRRLELGDSLFVIGENDIWRALEGFQATEDCTCSP